MINNIIKNKKGGTPPAILILVIIAVVLCGFALFRFITASKIDATISDVRWVENIYVQENNIKYMFFQFSEQSLDKVYSENMKKTDLIDRFKTELKNSVMSYNYQDKNFDKLKERIAHDEFDCNIVNNKLEVDVKNLNIELDRTDKDNVELMSAIYGFQLNWESKELKTSD